MEQLSCCHAFAESFAVWFCITVSSAGGPVWDLCPVLLRIGYVTGLSSCVGF